MLNLNCKHIQDQMPEASFPTKKEKEKKMPTLNLWFALLIN